MYKLLILKRILVQIHLLLYSETTTCTITPSSLAKDYNPLPSSSDKRGGENDFSTNLFVIILWDYYNTIFASQGLQFTIHFPPLQTREEVSGL